MIASRFQTVTTSYRAYLFMAAQKRSFDYVQAAIVAILSTHYEELFTMSKMLLTPCYYSVVSYMFCTALKRKIIRKSLTN